MASDAKTRLLRTAYLPLQRLACRCSDLTIFYNRDDLAYFVKAGMAPPDRCALVPGSGIVTSQFRRGQVASEALAGLRRDLDLQEGEVVVTMIARVCRSKGVLEFAEAAGLVRAKLPQVRFVLVGPDEQDVQDGLTPAELARVRKSVSWLGERQDIMPVLAVSDICALPTFYREGIPRVLLEAASMGLPLIATDAPGCREVVRPGVNGFLIPLKDAAGLARAVERLAADENLRQAYGLASRQLAKPEFDIDIVSEKIAALYRLCLGSPGPFNGLSS